jgi:hypothetical protein
MACQVDGTGCLQTVRVQFIHGSGCHVNATFTISPVYMGCGAGIAATDCPLQGPGPGTLLSFEYTTANLCPPDGAANRIDGLARIEGFWAVPRDQVVRDAAGGAPAGQATWMFGVPVYMRMDFGGVALMDVRVDTVRTDWRGDAYKTLYSARGVDGAPAPPASLATGTVDGDGAGDARRSGGGGGGRLGFTRATQTLVLAHAVDASFAAPVDRAVAVNPAQTDKKTLRYTLCT